VPDSGVIAAVSETLQTVLTTALSTLQPAPAPVAEVHDLQGTISTNPARLTLFLFEVGEDPSARNRPRVRGSTSSNGTPNVTLQKPPMALLLRYLLTPWGGDRLTEHRMLGRAMQVLYDHAILSGPDLLGNLAGTDQALKITLSPLTLDERSRVWFAVERPYRLSASYEVRVVNLDSETVEQFTPVTRRTLDAAAPEGIS
jgi:Pvc16 N-terminal domain